MTKKKSNPPDILKNLKTIGYYHSHMDETSKIDDLARFAKFYLCHLSGRLFKDPIWDTYTTEEMLIEYFAHAFYNDKKMREDFEIKQLGIADDIYEWLEGKANEAENERKERLRSTDDSVSFTPDQLGD